jgi:mitotic spindle assembly checkpoint protein MAD2
LLMSAVTADDQVKAYIKKIMSQLKEWMYGGKITKLVIVITSKETGEHVERWQFDVRRNNHPPTMPRLTLCRSKSSENKPRANLPRLRWIRKTQPQSKWVGKCQRCALTYSQRGQEDAPEEKTEAEIQAEIQSVFRQITASVTFLPMLDGNCTFNVLVYADADSDVPLEWGDSDAKEIENGEKVQLRSFSSSNHRVDTLVSYRYVKIILRW